MKYKVKVVFGQYPCEVCQESGFKAAQRYVREIGDGEAVTKSFDSDKERRAYLNAIEDASYYMNDYNVYVYDVYETKR